MTYNEAVALLPAGAKWSSSFGYPGEGGYVEYWRDPNDVVCLIENGSWMAFAPFDWTVRILPAMPRPETCVCGVPDCREYPPSGV